MAEAALRQLLEQGRPLHSPGTEAMLQDIMIHQDILQFDTAFDAVKDRNLLCITGMEDLCAPAEQMFLPLWKLLQAHDTGAIQCYLDLPTGHGLLGCRITLIRAVAQFLRDTCS